MSYILLREAYIANTRNHTSGTSGDSDKCFMYRIIHRLMYFPPNIVVPSCTPSHYTRSYSLHQPFAHTDSCILFYLALYRIETLYQSMS